MRDIIYLQNIYRQKHETASRPTGTERIVDLPDGYDAS